MQVLMQKLDVGANGTPVFLEATLTVYDALPGPGGSKQLDFRLTEILLLPGLDGVSKRADMAAELLRVAHRSEILERLQVSRAARTELFEFLRSEFPVTTPLVSSPFKSSQMSPG
jgi:hypothetical protein